MHLAAVTVWLVLLALIPLGDADSRVRDTIRLALLFALPAAMMMPWLPAGGRLARLLWTLAWLAYFIHVATAFHHAHNWSHAEAVDHVQRRSGFGQGIWFSHLFTAIGVYEIAWWWLAPVTPRPRWLNATVYGYLAFMAFNATVVYETGFIRAGGLTMCLLIGISGAGRFFFAGSSSSRSGSRSADLPDSSSITQQPRT